MSRYRVEFLEQVHPQLARLPQSIQRRMLERITNLEDDPRPRGSRALHGRLAGRRRLRVGDHRALYVVNDDQRLVTVVSAGHRRHVYDDAERGA